MNDERLERAIRAALGDLVAAAPGRHDVPSRPDRRSTTGRGRLVVAATAGLTAAAGIVAVVAISTRTSITTEVAGPTPGVTATAQPASTPTPSTTSPGTTTPGTTTPGTTPSSTTSTTEASTTVAPTSTAAPTPGPAQRVQFRSGTNDAAVDGTVVPGTTDRYLLEAAEGQRMIVDVDTEVDGLALSITGPDGSQLAAGGAVAAVDLPADGDYLVEVRPGGTAGDYTITFYIM